MLQMFHLSLAPHNPLTFTLCPVVAFCNRLHTAERSFFGDSHGIEIAYMFYNRWTVKLWLIYAMRYSAIKKNEIMRFSGKWMSLEKIRLREVTYTTPLKMSHILYHLLVTPNPQMWLCNMEYLKKQESGMEPWDVVWRHSTLKTRDLYCLGWI